MDRREIDSKRTGSDFPQELQGFSSRKLAGGLMIHHHGLIDQEERNQTHVSLWPEVAGIGNGDRCQKGLLRSAFSSENRWQRWPDIERAGRGESFWVGSVVGGWPDGGGTSRQREAARVEEFWNWTF